MLVDPEQGWNAADAYEPGGRARGAALGRRQRRFSGADVTPWNGGAVDAQLGRPRRLVRLLARSTEPGLYYVFDPKNGVRSHPFEIGRRRVPRGAEDGACACSTSTARTSRRRRRTPASGEALLAAGRRLPGPGQDNEARSVTDARRTRRRRATCSGGWWDAGDTNKYVTFSERRRAPAAHGLRRAAAARSATTSASPSPATACRTLIDELLVELDWLKKMQPADLGGGALLKMGNVEHGDPVPGAEQVPALLLPGALLVGDHRVAGEFAHAALVLARSSDACASYADDLTRARASAPGSTTTRTRRATPATTARSSRATPTARSTSKTSTP